MKSRQEFAEMLSKLDLSHVDRAIAFLYYYRQTQDFEERSASGLANDLQEEGFPKPNVTRFRKDLARTRFTIRGRRPGTFQLDLRRIAELDEKYGELLKIKKIVISDSILPAEMVAETRLYLEKMVQQINGCYEYGFYDGCAVICRRLMESLIVEIYIHRGRHQELQQNRMFLPLERLIAYICSDQTIALGRNTPKTMNDIKQLGDTAAHDRVYITQQRDIDDIKARYRKMIQELFSMANIVRKSKEKP